MAAPLKGISSMATRHMLQRVLAQWRQDGGAAIEIESVGGVDATKRVAAATEHFDLVFLASEAIDQLQAAGRTVPGSKVDVVQSNVAVAVPANASAPTSAPSPVIATEAALRDAVLAAPSIGYSTGPSGTALLALFERWHITAQLAGKLVQAPAGVPVGQLIAQGQVALGFQQRSELIHVQGIALLGDMPAELGMVTTFSAACVHGSERASLALEFLQFLRTPGAAAIQREEGFVPA